MLEFSFGALSFPPSALASPRSRDLVKQELQSMRRNDVLDNRESSKNFVYLNVNLQVA